MKQFLSVFILIFVLLGGIAFFYTKTYQTQETQQQTTPAPSNTPNVILFPAGNETLTQGQTYILKWTEGASNLQIFLIDKDLQPQGEAVSIIDQVFDVPNTGSYPYTVPKDAPNGNYIIKIGTLSSQPFQISNTKNEQSTVSCKPTDIKATISFEGAAGSTYGTASLTNTSQKPCNVQGNQYIKPQFSASNIEVSEQELVDLPILVLQPNQTIYSQVRYTNGAQCSGPTQAATVSFSYPISTSTTVTFKDSGNKAQQTVPVCQNVNEITELLVWGLFDQPLNK